MPLLYMIKYCSTVLHNMFSSAFARYPDGEVEHYYCAKENIAKEQLVSLNEQEQSSLQRRELQIDTNPF